MRFALALIALPLLAQDSLLDRMNAIAQQQLDRREAAVAAVTTRAAAEVRQREIRAKLLEVIGGLPGYNGPLNPRIAATIKRPGFLIEKLTFESLPRYVVTGNLYRPDAPGRYPGVLFPLGHWTEGKAAAQRIAMNLARKGFVVLAFDPMGQGERMQAYDSRLRTSIAGSGVEQHILAGLQAVLAGETFAKYRVWDAKRALDYLVSRPEVDANRIGCTGCSGGGTVATYISALDDRIKVTAPACYLNTFRKLFTGPTGDSEQSLPNFLAAGLDLGDYVEAFAPKPYLIVSTEKDFFPLDGAEHVYTEAKRWWTLFDAGERIDWAVGPGGHGTPTEVRTRIYDWMIRWLKDGKGDAREEDVEILPAHELWVTSSGQVDSRETWEFIRESWTARRKPASFSTVLKPLIEAERAPADITITAPQTPGRHPAVILVDGTAAQVEATVALGAVAVVVKPRGSTTGRAQTLRWPGDWITNTRSWLIGHALAAMRAADISAAADVAAARTDVDSTRITAAARGMAGFWAMYAAAADPRITRVWIDRAPPEWPMNSALHRDAHDAAIPGIALAGSLEDLRKAARVTVWSDPVDWTGALIPSTAGALYRAFDETDERFLKALLR